MGTAIALRYEIDRLRRAAQEDDLLGIRSTEKLADLLPSRLEKPGGSFRQGMSRPVDV